MRRIHFTRLPKVLMVQLKRFQYIDGENRKITDTFKYYDDIQVGEVDYTLFSVVVHEGTHSNNGHYYSFIKKEKHQWLLFNDEKVQRVHRKQVFNYGGVSFRPHFQEKSHSVQVSTQKDTSTAYILIYIQKEHFSAMSASTLTLPPQIEHTINQEIEKARVRKRKQDQVKVFLVDESRLQHHRDSMGSLLFWPKSYNDKSFGQKLLRDMGSICKARV